MVCLPVSPGRQLYTLTTVSTNVGVAWAGEERGLTLVSGTELELFLTGHATLTDRAKMRVSDITSLRMVITAQA